MLALAWSSSGSRCALAATARAIFTAGAAQAKVFHSRSEALEVLGLDQAATATEIKKRHREMVREFHPDKHQHLGEVAAKEAEERFRMAQSAYEVLTD